MLHSFVRSCRQVVGLLVLALPITVLADAVPEHPLLPAYPNSTFLGERHNEHNRFVFPLGVPEDDKQFSSSLPREGELSQYVYEIASGASALQVFRNYEQALQKAGATIQYSCLDNDCIGKDGYHLILTLGVANALASSHENERFGYLTASLNQNGDDYVVGVIAGQYSDYTRYELVVMKVADMETGLISVREIQDSLLTLGKVALYGIFFDTGKAEVKPESGPNLDAIVSFLNDNSEVDLFVVGHTDITGGFDANVSLSKRRAEAVVKALQARGVSAARLQADGVGPLAPVASNQSAAGRQKNRRVELVVKNAP